MGAFRADVGNDRSFIDFFGEEADDWTFIKEHSKEGANTPDEEMLTILNKVLAKNRKRELIVLHCYGSHFNYRERYPRSEAFFRPDDASEAKASNRQQLVNAYDNSIRQTDRLLHDIIAALRKTGAVAAMLYTSDHGENIFDDDRKLFLHASPTPSYYELHVPLIAWVSESYDRLYPGIHATLVANRHKPGRLSCMGFSMGAYRSWMLSALSDKVKLGVAICWMHTTEYQINRDYGLKHHEEWANLIPADGTTL